MNIIKFKKCLAYVLCASMMTVMVQPAFAAAGAKVMQKSQLMKQQGSPSDAQKEFPDLSTASNARRATNSLGDIWDSWSGKTSFEFLNGSQGLGTKENPYMIKNKEQLMGLSELTAMGMGVSDGDGASYVGDYSGCYFALAGTIDLQGIGWIPIGFYTDSTEKNGEIVNAFRGKFDGNGHSIKNFRLNQFLDYDSVGLFGAAMDSEIVDVVVIPEVDTKIMGKNNVGILVGKAERTKIKDIVVKGGSVEAAGIAGGIVGEASESTIENAECDNVKINAKNGSDIIYAGGIAGMATASALADCRVSTGDGLTARIQGTGYIGGIVGCQNGTDIFNTQVSGTIGGNGSRAIGGITGEYVAGKIKVARFDGTIGNSRLGADAREGTFIGTRKGAGSNFNYGEDVAYLFTDTQSKISANVCGSAISDDNDYTYEDHIGFWHSGDLFYTLVEGGNSKEKEAQYFYEELEQGILSVMDNESGDYTIDHFAPNTQGRPVRGNLVMVEQIDTVANGQSFHDVAFLTVQGSSQYSRVLDKEHRGALAADSIVYVNTAPNNTDTEKYEMNGVPYYRTETLRKNTAYSNSDHCYTFQMPKENISVSSDYKKVAVSIGVAPESYRFAVTQTRTGNRKNPTKTTVIKDNAGKLIATYINGELKQDTQVQPVMIRATVDANNDVKDSRVRWSVDDSDLISLTKNLDEDTDGYTAQSASISLNLNAPFFEKIIEKLEKEQTEGNYQYQIPGTIYGAGHQNGGVAILTAQTRPSESFEEKPCTDNCRINTTFQILDNTLVAGEGAILDKQTMEFKVVRTLTGDRKNPEEKITATVPQSLAATFTPDFFSKQEVKWSTTEESILGVSQDAVAYKEAQVAVYKDAKWIRDIIAADQAVKENDNYSTVSGNGKRTATVMVTADDQLGNKNTASCDVMITFQTDDKTRIVPEGIVLDQESMNYNLVYHKAGDSRSETMAKEGFESKQLTAHVLPELENTQIHNPYDRTVTWTSSEPSAAFVDGGGRITIMENADWIQEAQLLPPYEAKKTVIITATPKDGTGTALCKLNLSFSMNCIEADRDMETFDIVLTKTGKRSAPVLSYTGQDTKQLNAAIYGRPDMSRATWTSSDETVLTVDQNGTITPLLLNDKNEVIAPWIQAAMSNYPYRAEKTIQIISSSSDGVMSDPITVSLTFKVVDKTYSGGGSGGSSSGGGGSSSTGVTPGGSKTSTTKLPSYVVSGTWVQNAAGKWLFTGNGRTYGDEWAAIQNPYADTTKGQADFDWFHLDKDGFMTTGWFTDQDGSTYFLNDISDNTLGRMVTGWRWIGERCYYFNAASDGIKGALLKSCITPDGSAVNERGQWMINGVVQIQTLIS